VAHVSRWRAFGVPVIDGGAVFVGAPAGVVLIEYGEAVNVAVTASAATIVTVHELVPEQPPPDQPANVLPAAGSAVSVTWVP
jgi:zinc transporter ZupT